MRTPRDGRVVHGCAVLGGWHRPLLNWARAVKRSTLARSGESRRAILSGHAERCLRALGAMLQRRLPARSWVHKSLCCCARSWLCCFVLGGSSCADRVDGGARRRRNANAVGIVLEAAFDAISGRQEGIEPLNQIRMPGKQFRNPADDARCVDSSIALAHIINALNCSSLHPRLALEIFHDVEEPIVYVRVVVELHLDLVEVAQRILVKMGSAVADQKTGSCHRLPTLSIGCCP